MAFIIYKKYGNAETVRYESFKLVKLGGAAAAAVPRDARRPRPLRF